MLAPAVFAFGLVAFGFLGMGPVTIAVDSYGPVTDNAQSVFELSTIEQPPNAQARNQAANSASTRFREGQALPGRERRRGQHIKATAKPVLIGTAVVGATTMIFSIIMMLTDGLTTMRRRQNLSLLHPPFLLGLITGGAVIYWFTGASTQAVVTGAYRAVEFIKANIKLDSDATKASIEDSKRVVAICTQYAQHGMFNIFLAVFFITLAFACLERVLLHRLPDLDRDLRLVPGDLHGQRRRRLGQRQEDRRSRTQRKGHAAARGHGRRRHGRRSVQGHVIGRAQPDHQVHDAVRACWRSSLAVNLTAEQGSGFSRGLRCFSSCLSLIFVWRSFYGMRITNERD